MNGALSTNTRKAALAGVLIAIGALFSISAAPYGRVVQGLCFSVGLFGVLVTSSRLFTGKMLMVRELFDGHGERLWPIMKELAGIWALNLVGAVCVALMACVMHADASYAAQYRAAMQWPDMLVRAMLCNVLVCLAVSTYQRAWCSSWSVADAFLSCLLPVACFVACGFEHSVADMLYMMLGLFEGHVGIIDCMRVLAVATAGNVIGGIVFTWLVHTPTEELA